MASTLDGYPVTAPPLTGRVVFDQVWADLTFVHWPVRPHDVAPLLPPGVRPDVFDDGFSYVGLVPFAMRRAGFGTGRPIPYFGSFLETNIRLYSVDDAGRHGVVFRSLDTARLAIVPFARLAFGTPYIWSRMRLTRDGDLVRYETRRRWPDRGPRSLVEVRPGPRLEPSPLQVWLTARWGLHSTLFGRSVWIPNEHGPWPLHAAEVVTLHDNLLGASGVTAAGPSIDAMYSPGVRTRFGLPVRVPGQRSRTPLGS